MNYSHEGPPPQTGTIGTQAAAIAAHDLCNHLQVISSALNQIERSVDRSRSEPIDVIFAGARASLERAGRLTRTIVESGASGGQGFARVCLVERLKVLGEMALLACGPDVSIEQITNDDIPDVYCDGDRLGDAVLNIVVNAIRAMPRGGKILISASREVMGPNDLPYAVLRVADTGCGMTPEVAASAFRPRFTTREKYGGSGLGLAMVADFVRSAGGSADIESWLGTGTIVSLRLPGILKKAKAAHRD